MAQTNITQICERTNLLNHYRDMYYNHSQSLVSDQEYDRLYDELEAWERKAGFHLANSPTQTVGFTPVSGLEKVQHTVPLLSLEKTKSGAETLKFMGSQPVLYMHKLDGLTLKLEYRNGRLIRCSTRGDGNTGEDVTHNACAISGIPSRIPYYDPLVVIGEAYIKISDFSRMQKDLEDAGEDVPKTARNLASGSIRLFDPAECARRCLRFTPFRVQERLNGNRFKYGKLRQLEAMGFDLCEMHFSPENSAISSEELLELFEQMREHAESAGIPIDGIVVTYDDIAFSATCKNTGSKYKDGIAFKWEDEEFETVFRSIEWNTTRSGLISPVALFDPVEIDGTSVARATLHNVSNIWALKLAPCCRIMVSKRNMIIPHVESNLDPQEHGVEIPTSCPCCGTQALILTSTASGKAVENLYCTNEQCPARHIAAFIHFVSRKAMNIEGLSEATLEKFIGAGWLKTFPDIYHLNEHREEIVAMEGFGDKSYERLWNAIDASRSTTFERFVIACDIPLVGRHASAILANEFGSLKAFEDAAKSLYLFNSLDGIGETIHKNIHKWFQIADNLALWNDLMKEVSIMTNSTQNTTGAQDNPFSGKTVVVTGTLPSYTRGEIEGKLYSIGAKPTGSVSKNTDFVLVGDKPGSKLTKAQALGVTVIDEAKFLQMLGE